jgi:hypothetical protein
MHMQLLSMAATAVKKMAIPLPKAKDVLWFNIIKCVKRVQQCYQTEFQVDPPSEGSILHFTNNCMRQVALREGEVPFALNCVDGTECQLDVWSCQ